MAQQKPPATRKPRKSKPATAPARARSTKVAGPLEITNEGVVFLILPTPPVSIGKATLRGQLSVRMKNIGNSPLKVRALLELVSVNGRHAPIARELLTPVDPAETTWPVTIQALGQTDLIVSSSGFEVNFPTAGGSTEEFRCRLKWGDLAEEEVRLATSESLYVG